MNGFDSLEVSFSVAHAITCNGCETSDFHLIAVINSTVLKNMKDHKNSAGPA